MVQLMEPPTELFQVTFSVLLVFFTLYQGLLKRVPPFTRTSKLSLR